MKAQVTLTTAESKKLLAKAVAATSLVRNAKKRGIIAIHPSSTTYFLVKELTGKYPEGVWVCGMIIPKGACVHPEALDIARTLEDVTEFPFTWVLERGKFITGLKLSSILEKMGKKDVYVKGVNAIDAKGNVGVLYVKPGAGTIGQFYRYSKRKGFTIIIPVGLEKLIPTTITKAAKTATRSKIDVAMGLPLGLFPIQGNVITEIDAIYILSKAEAIVMSAGGLQGAEGASTFIVQGAEDKVKKALKILREVKGASLPNIPIKDCRFCSHHECHLRGQ